LTFSNGFFYSSWCANSKFQFVAEAVSKIHSKQLLYKMNKRCLASYHMLRSLQLFDKAFSTFHVKFIKIINVDKITNAFVKNISILSQRLLAYICASTYIRRWIGAANILTKNVCLLIGRCLKHRHGHRLIFISWPY